MTINYKRRKNNYETMLFSDNITSVYSLRCIRVSTCTYMCACLTVFLT